MKSTNLYKHLYDTGYTVQRKDLPAAAKVMAAAFGDDASIRYLLGGEKMGKHDWKYFHCVLKAVFGKCVMLSADENINSLLVLFPPQLRSVPVLAFLVRGGIGLYRFFGWGLFLRSLRYEKNCCAVKRKFMTPQTWYCMCFVVSPQLQGQGLGSRLLRPVLNILDSAHIPLYLETHKTVNTSIYGHFGFSVVGTSSIPGTDILQYAMLRK